VPAGFGVAVGAAVLAGFGVAVGAAVPAGFGIAVGAAVRAGFGVAVGAAVRAGFGVAVGAAVLGGTASFIDFDQLESNMLSPVETESSSKEFSDKAVELSGEISGFSVA